MKAKLIENKRDGAIHKKGCSKHMMEISGGDKIFVTAVVAAEVIHTAGLRIFP